MEWTHLDGMSVSGSGAVVVRVGGEWESFPFGAASGASGLYLSRDEAIAAAEHVAVGVHCCSGEGSGECG
ncbi:MAG: hypothetical protein HQL33_06190 [Alphaproteobacteria bacterium]|nr:hypothetical protein [Alphaproteobacteria bacterium]MBF0129562.1 hypothetical protein [Alphaproteobacteria bacterium]